MWSHPVIGHWKSDALLTSLAPSSAGSCEKGLGAGEDAIVGGSEKKPHSSDAEVEGPVREKAAESVDWTLARALRFFREVVA